MLCRSKMSAVVKAHSITTWYMGSGVRCFSANPLTRGSPFAGKLWRNRPGGAVALQNCTHGAATDSLPRFKHKQQERQQERQQEKSLAEAEGVWGIRRRNRRRSLLIRSLKRGQRMERFFTKPAGRDTSKRRGEFCSFLLLFLYRGRAYNNTACSAHS